jgi:hypothetical protein
MKLSKDGKIFIIHICTPNNNIEITKYLIEKEKEEDILAKKKKNLEKNETC